MSKARNIAGLNSGPSAKVTTASTGGNLSFDNGTSDTPGVSFYDGDNSNFGIDVYSGRLRVVKNVNEAGGVEVGGVGTKAVYAGNPLGSPSSNDIGFDSYSGDGSTSYSRWRVYEGSTPVNTATIHKFSNAWSSGNVEGGSSGAWNIDWGASGGVTFGTWDNPSYTFTNTRALVKGDRHTIYGPNSSWGAYLRVGGNGDIDPATHASVVTTNGNLHLDPITGKETYINWYAGSITNIGAGNGGGYGTVKYGALQQISDYRIKNGVAEVNSAAVNSFYNIKFKQFSIYDSEKTSYGVIAHELQELLPDAVMGVKDQLHENGTALMQSVDYQQVFVLACKAVQEQQATIAKLTARVAVLEAAYPKPA